MESVVIRSYKREDRGSIRRISCETAFLEEDSKKIFGDDEILADALTRYFTDYEPESCFVADDGGRVIGYIIGSKDVRLARRVFIIKLLPSLIVKAIKRAIFFNKSVVRFLYYGLISFLKGEFFTPDLSRKYPGTLHINIESDYRGKKIGRKLIEAYLASIRREGVRGVHFGTISKEAKNFFVHCGFSILHQGRRSCLRYALKQDTSYYVLGKLL